MKQVFADTNYWVALVDPTDQFKAPALAAAKALGKVKLVTTDEVLSELLSFFCKEGPHLRGLAVKMIASITTNTNVRVLPQTRDSFLRGLKHYEERPDKEYSLVDCTSMMAMRAEGIQDVLTNDHHFTQDGFNILIRV